MRKPSDPLGRFYTDPLVGQAFASMFDSEDPASVIDLGAGSGSLSAAVSGRWREAAIQTVDLDPAAGKASNSRIAASGCRKHRHLTADILDERLPDALEGSLFDLCVSNPPYTALGWRKGFSRILDEAGFGRITEPGRPVPAEALFLAQLLRLSRPGAEIGLILSDGMVAARRHTAFRQAMIERLWVKRVVQLPRNSFNGTEAQAYAVICVNEPGAGRPVDVSRLDASGWRPATFPLDAHAAASRMDYGFHSPSSGDGDRSSFTLRGIGAEVRRGSLTSTEVGLRGTAAFHTSSFARHPPSGCRLSTEFTDEDRPGMRIAEPGDILVARVDRALHEKVCFVASGRAAITDCVYRVRVLPEWRPRVLAALTSPAGRQALSALARGVGPRMLNREDLLDLPLDCAIAESLPAFRIE